MARILQAQGVMKAIGILICDDSAFMRVTLRHIIDSDSDLRVMDIARNGEEAIEAGAFDFILKFDELHSMDLHSAAIIRKLKQAAASNIYRKIHQEPSPIDTKDKSWFLSSSPPKSFNTGGKGFKAVALGLSTGGPRSIFKVLPQLPADLNAAIIVVQHMPPAFISAFTQRLNKKTAVECVESEPGLKLVPKKIYIAFQHAPGSHQAGRRPTDRPQLGDRQPNCKGRGRKPPHTPYAPHAPHEGE